jgi:hypothetical protein
VSVADQPGEVTTADRNVDSALNLTIERARPIPFSLTSGEAREKATNRRTDDRRRATDLRKGNLSGRPPGEQATLDRIAATDKRVRRLNRRPAEPKQARTASEQPQLEHAVPLSLPDETVSDSLDLAPVNETKVLRSGLGEFDDRLVKHDALLGLDCTVARLTLPRLPTIHLEDGSQPSASGRGTRERSQV